MKYTLYYSYIDNKELLLESIASVKDAFSNIVIVNNSKEDLSDIANIKIIEAQVPLSFSQVMNFFNKMSLEKGDDYWIWSHTDAVAEEGTAHKFKQFIEKNYHKNWGTMHTNYDIISAWHPIHFDKIGGFDCRMFPNYCADNDMYRRMDLAGYEILLSNLPVLHKNGGSNTIKKDNIWKREHDINYPFHIKVYEACWGGIPGEETFQTKYNL